MWCSNSLYFCVWMYMCGTALASESRPIICRIDPLHWPPLLRETFMHEELSLAASRAQRVHPWMFPLFVIKDGRQCKGSTPGLDFVELLKQTIVLQTFLLSTNTQGISCKWYTWHAVLAGNLFPVSWHILCFDKFCAYNTAALWNRKSGFI